MLFIKRLLSWLGAHLDAIDAEHVRSEVPPSTGHLLGLSYFSALMLLLLNYIVINYENQYALALLVVELAGRLGGPEAAETWSFHVPLIMKGTWSAGCIFFYLVLPGLYTRLVLRRRLRDLGISPRGFLRHLHVYVILFLPVLASVYFVSFRREFQETYPFYHFPASMAHLALWELMYGLQFFSLEFFFRGFMLAGWRERIGWKAILVMMIPYCMIHFPKPALEAAGAIIAGSVLGILALRTRSIWGGVAIHVTVAWTMDLMSLWQRGFFRGGSY
ncbi:MAG: CPBP family intramembrane metalloprotease [Deltaproteobacteria bacterium]|nr:CPBP family intramembrane metalloprotease [Deltaproteobacteria bacterium]